MRSKVDAMLGMSLYYRICTPERITKRTRHESAGFFLLKRFKFILKSNLKGKIQQLQSSWGSMLGMSLFHRICTPPQRRSGSQLQSEKQKRERYSPLFFLRFHTLSRFFGAPSHSFYAMLDMSLFHRICTPSQRRSGSQMQSEKQ